jgi:hypothetical protein
MPSHPCMHAKAEVHSMARESARPHTALRRSHTQARLAGSSARLPSHPCTRKKVEVHGMVAMSNSPYCAVLQPHRRGCRTACRKSCALAISPLQAQVEVTMWSLSKHCSILRRSHTDAAARWLAGSPAHLPCHPCIRKKIGGARHVSSTSTSPYCTAPQPHTRMQDCKAAKHLLQDACHSSM